MSPLGLGKAVPFRRRVVFPSSDWKISGRFILHVKSDNSGTSNSDQFQIRNAAVSTGSTFDVTYSSVADPGNQTTVNLNVSDPTVTFPVAGEYYIQIAAPFYGFQFILGGDRFKVLDVVQWGLPVWRQSLAHAFTGCSNLNVTALDAPNFAEDSDTSYMFYFVNFTTPNVAHWDMSNVSNATGMFNTTNNFNVSLANWPLRVEGTAMGSIFASSGLSCANFTETVVGWANYVFENSGPYDVVFTLLNTMVFGDSESGGANFATAEDAREYLFAATPTGAGWTWSNVTIQANC